MSKFVAPLLVLLLSAPAIADPKADEIVAKVAAQPTPKSSAVKLKMTLISNRGAKPSEQIRTVEMFAQQSPEGSRSLLRFKSPSDVAGVALLVVENKGAANDQWLYMPALKQEPRRISAGQKNQSFLGTDFTFADLEGRDPGAWRHTLLREESVSGQAAWVIESTPAAGTESDYKKTVQWVRQDAYVPVRVEFYDERGMVKVLTVDRLAKSGEFWTAGQTRMENIGKKHATVLEIEEQKNDIDFPADFFTPRRLKGG